MMISPAMGSKPTSWWGFHPKKHPERRCLWLSQRDQDVWLEIPPAKDTFGRILHQLVDGKHPTYSLWWFIPYSISYHLSYHLFPTGAGHILRGLSAFQLSTLRPMTSLDRSWHRCWFTSTMALRRSRRPFRTSACALPLDWRVLGTTWETSGDIVAI